MTNWMWQTPEWLVLLGLPVLLWIGLKIWRRQAHRSVVDPALLPWIRGTQSAINRRVSAWTALAFAWWALVIALANPMLLTSQQQAAGQAGVDYVHLLDLSRSMQVADVLPNRFLQARALMEAQSRRLNPQDRVALNVFSAQAHNVMPFTFDHQLLPYYLNAVQPNQLPLRGSDLLTALEFTAQELDNTAGSSRVVVVWTDGADLAQGYWLTQSERLQALAQQAVHWVFVGVGTKTGGQVPNTDHPSGWLMQAGSPVISVLAAHELQQLAEGLQGTFLKADGGFAFQQALHKAVQQTEGERAAHSERVGQSWALPWVAIAGLSLLWAFVPIRLAWYGVVLLFGLVAWLVSPMTWASESEAYAAFQQQDYSQAQQLYRQQFDFSGALGVGSSAYRQADFVGAAMAFRQALLRAMNDSERASALFNLGNSYARLESWQVAAEAYQQALKYAPQHLKAAQNLAWLQKKLTQKAQDDGAGGGRSEQDGAFYGGQKPNEEGGTTDQELAAYSPSIEPVLPKRADATSSSIIDLSGSLSTQSAGSRLQAQLTRQGVRARFQQKLNALEAKQGELLQRLFEREAGFQAVQSEPHVVPGVKPW